MAPGTMQQHGAHQQADNRPNPLVRFREMMNAHNIDMRSQLNKLESCGSALTRSEDRVTLDTLPTLHKVVDCLRASQVSLQRSWEQYEGNTNSS
jgi:hypothetical protein